MEKFKPAKKLKFVKKWPESIFVLEAKHLCLGSLKDNGRSCLLGQIAMEFIDGIDPRQMNENNFSCGWSNMNRKDEWREDMPGMVSENHIEKLLASSKIGQEILRSFVRAIHEAAPGMAMPLTLNKILNLPSVNDKTEVFGGLYNKSREVQHLGAIARIYNRAMELCGYNCGEPNPLPSMSV